MGEFGNPELLTDTEFESEFYIRGKNPFIPNLMDMWIDANGTITFDFQAGTIGLAGLTDDFPSFEMYMRIDNYFSTPTTVNVMTKTAVPPVTNIYGAADIPFSHGGLNF